MWPPWRTRRCLITALALWLTFFTLPLRPCQAQTPQSTPHSAAFVSGQTPESTPDSAARLPNLVEDGFF